MKQLSETENVYPVTVSVRDGVASPEMVISGSGARLMLDQTTAAELLPMLAHFIATGELPE